MKFLFLIVGFSLSIGTLNPSFACSKSKTNSQATLYKQPFAPRETRVAKLPQKIAATHRRPKVIVIDSALPKQSSELTEIRVPSNDEKL